MTANTNAAMVAAQGMLNFPFLRCKAKPPLTLQLPSITVTSPVQSPDCQTGAPDSDNRTNDTGKRLSSDVEAVDSRAHFGKDYVEIKRLGNGDNGEAFAAIAKPDLIALINEHGTNNGLAFFDAVRAKMVAVKFAKVDNIEGDLSNEIKFLTDTFTRRHPSVTYAVDAHLDDDCQWLVLPYVGGSLDSFINKFDTDISLSFRWHIAGGIAEALLCFFFGVEDAANPPATAPKCLKAVHQDLYPCNVLLGPPKPADFTGFPGVVLADFGRAVSLSKMTDDDAVEAMSSELSFLGSMLRYMTKDYFDATNRCSRNSDQPAEDDILGYDGFCIACSNVELNCEMPVGSEKRLKEVCEELHWFKPTESDFSDAYQLLCDVVDEANFEKRNQLQPLSAKAAECINTPCVSDEDLRKALGIFSRPIAKPKSRRIVRTRL